MNTWLDRPSTMSNSRAGPVPSRTGVKSMITVTNSSPLRVCRHACSSTPMSVTPSKRAGSAINTRRPSASTASLAVSQGPIRFEELARRLQTETVQPGEGGQVRVGEGSVSHVEVLRMSGVRTFILRGPRPHPGTDLPTPTTP